MSAFAQERNQTLKDKIHMAETLIPGLNEEIDISVNEISISELLYSIGTSAGLNIDADDKLAQKVNANFKKVKVSDLLLFLSERYLLDFRIIGEIISFYPYSPSPPVYKRNLESNDSTKRITFDLRNDTLGKVLKDISERSGINFQYDQSLYSHPVTCFLKDGTFSQAISSIAKSANLKQIQLDSSLYRFEQLNDRLDKLVGISTVTSQPSAQIKSHNNSGHETEFRMTADGLLLEANHSDLGDLISQAATYFKRDYHYLDEIKGNITSSGTYQSFDDLLDKILLNTPYSFVKDENIYLIGSRLDEELRGSRIFTFRERSVQGISETIPAELKKGLEIKAFPELNAIIVSGSAPASSELIKYLEDIDRKVPVIDIEVYIADVRDSRSLSTGIQAGLFAGTSVSNVTSGGVYPDADVEIGAVTVNEIMTGITRLGILRLGQVGPAFFLKLKLLEEQGTLRIRSTPRLATLNGHEARLSIGRTEYYLEIQNNVIGTQNPQNLISQQYKSVNADLSLVINPIVSESQDITLDIHVQQSNFTERISPSAPPGTISRDFQSLVRVRNGEMIILGGLEEDSKSETAHGLPVLSRIPVLKWIFSSRNKSKSKSKLTIFIRPTVTFF